MEFREGGDVGWLTSRFEFTSVMSGRDRILAKVFGGDWQFPLCIFSAISLYLWVEDVMSVFLSECECSESDASILFVFGKDDGTLFLSSLSRSSINDSE